MGESEKRKDERLLLSSPPYAHKSEEEEKMRAQQKLFPLCKRGIERGNVGRGKNFLPLHMRTCTHTQKREQGGEDA